MAVGAIETTGPAHLGGGRVDLDVVELDVAAAAKAASAPVLHDIYLADSFAPRLSKRGVRCQEVGMSSAEQARRANLLATYVREHRLRLPDGHPELLRQLKNLRVTRHAGGRITVAAPKGKKHHDDLADVVLLLLDGARTLAATGGDIEIVPARFLWNAQGAGLTVIPRKFFRTERGIRVPIEAPIGTPEHSEQQAARLARGVCCQADIDELGQAKVDELMGFARPATSLNRPVR